MSCRRKILIALAAALFAVLLVSIIHHYQLRFAVEKYIAELKAKGEPMDLAQVRPPPVPLEQNSADTFRDAVALFETDQSLLTTNSYSAMTMVAPGKAMICSQQPEIRGFNATNSWQEVTAAVAQNEESLALLRQIIEKPDFDFQIKYELGLIDLGYTNLNLAPLKLAALRLGTAALCDLHHGDTTSTVKNLRAMIALVKAARDERLVISELVRIAITQLALTDNWEILQSPNLTDEQFAALQLDWMHLEFIRSSENALVMERTIGKITLAKWRGSNAELDKNFELGRKTRENMGFPDEGPSALATAKRKFGVFMWRYWWSYPDELRSLKSYEVLINTVRLVETNGSFQNALSTQDTALDQLGIRKLKSSLDSLFSGEPDFHSMLSESIVTLGRTFQKVMRVEAAKQLTVAAIALKRFQSKHGKFPERLAELTPEFLNEVPLDPVDGKPLRYRRNADGTFLLYSVGENGKDDGGNPSLEKVAEGSSLNWLNPRALDWVWPQPATEEEIQKFFEERGKSGN